MVRNILQIIVLTVLHPLLCCSGLPGSAGAPGPAGVPGEKGTLGDKGLAGDETYGKFYALFFLL